MMWLLASILFLGFLSSQSTGYVYYVNDSRNNSICYTNENDGTVAFVWDLNNELIGDWANNFTDKYSNILSSSEEVNINCYLPDDCNLWETKDFDKHNNINDGKDTFPPVLDRRWNNLRQYAIKNDYNKVKFLEFQNEAKFHISLLSRDSAQIVFSRSKNLENGIIAVFDGWSHEHRCVLRYCKKIPTASLPSDCTTYSDIANLPILKEGSEWILLTVLLQTNHTNLEITVEHEGKSLMTANLVDKFGFRGIWFAGVRSHVNPVVMKLHNYTVLKPNRFNGARMFRNVEISSTSQIICLDVIYFNENIILTFNASILDSNQEKIKFSYVDPDERENSWRTRRIQADNLSIGTYTIEITVHDKNTAIGGIFPCHRGPEVVTSTAKGAKSCHSLRNTGQMRNFSSEDNGLKYHEAEALCKSFGLKDCSEVKYCFNQSKCSCLSGYTGVNCDIACRSGKFGPNCHSYTNVSNCNPDKHGKKYSRHTGNCLHGCVAGFRNPECLEELLVFKTGPPVTTIGAYSAQVDLTSEYERFKQTGQYVFFKEAEVYLSYEMPSAPSLNWSTVTVLNSSNLVYTIRNLTPNTSYQIKSVIREWDNQTNAKITPSVFETLPCTPRHANNTKASVDNQLNLTISNSVDNLNLCRSLKIKFLPWSKSRSMPSNIENNAETGNLPTFQLDQSYECNLCQLTLCRDDALNDCFTIAYSLQDSPMEDDDEPNHILIIVVLLIVVLIVVIISTLAFILIWKKKNITKTQRLQQEGQANDKGCDDEDIYMEPLPPSKLPIKDDLTRLVQVTELEKYVESAMQNNLLQIQFEFFPQGQTRPWIASSDPANVKKNRNTNIPAYDATRVILDLIPGDKNSHYINANYIDGYNRAHEYIATQGPEPETVYDFWRMIWQENVFQIVMMTNIEENGKEKCEKYWPDAEKSLIFLDFTVKNINEEIFADFVVRKLWLYKDYTKREITHLHFISWPEQEIPLYPQSVAAFTKKMEKSQYHQPNLVHSSAGIGRTGAFILVDICLHMARAEGYVDVPAVLAQLRSQRVNMVDTKDLFEFAHLVILEELVVPQFKIPCSSFSAEMNNLLAFGKRELIKEFTKLNKICENECARLECQEVVTESIICKFPELIASPSHYVKLYQQTAKEKTRFINAVFVDGFRRRNQFIATHMPMAESVNDFWLMIQQNKVEQIIVLQEYDQDEVIFYPKLNEVLELDGDMNVIAEKQNKDKDCLMITFSITLHGEPSGMVTMVRYQGWSHDKTCAPSIKKLVNLWEETERNRASGVSVIVCHDGVTACGLFLGMGFVLEKMKLEKTVDATLAARILRQARPGFIANQDQFEFLFKAALNYLQEFDCYGNFQ